MADSSLTVLDSNGTARAVDAATVGTDYQQTVTLGDGVNAGRYALLDTDGSQNVEVNRCANVAYTSVTAATTEVTILAANAQRRGAIVFNNGTGILYLKYGTTAQTGAVSATAWSVKLAAGASWVVDFPTWEGVIRGVWSATGGNAQITDMSA